MSSRQRSPNYPGVDLETAIELVKVLYGAVSRGQFTPTDAATAWGYGGPSGPARVRIAALRQYGLLDGQRGENPRLSRRALTFALRNQSSQEYKTSLSEAALTPTIFRELQDTMADATDSVLKEYLIIDRNFTDDGAERVIEVYRATMLLTELDNSADISGLYNDETPVEDKEDISHPESSPHWTANPVTAKVTSGSFSIPIPLDSERIATVTLPMDMSDADWKRLDRILEAYKPLETGNQSPMVASEWEICDHNTDDRS